MSDGRLDQLHGFDRHRLRALLAATDDAIAAAARVHHADWHAHEAVAAVAEARRHLAGPWRDSITAMLGGSWFEQLIAGAVGRVVIGTSSCRLPPSELRPFRDTPLAELLRRLDDFAWGWPRDRDGAFVTDVDDLDPDDRRLLRELAHRLDDDPTILAEFADAIRRGARLDDIEVLGMMAAARWLRPVVALQVAALVGLVSITHGSTSDVAQRRAAITEHVDDLLDVSPADALASLEDATVREWLVRDGTLDQDAVAALLARGIHSSTEEDDSLTERSEAVWLSFIDLAERHGGRGFFPGVAQGLALGAAAHLPGLAQSDLDIIFRRRVGPVEIDGRTLTHDELTTLLGSIVADPVAQAILAEIVFDVAVDGFRAQVALQSTDDPDPDSLAEDYRPVGEGLTPAVDIVDLVFDDALSFQQQRWNEIAIAEAQGRQDAIGLLTELAKLFPVAGSVARTVKTATTHGLGQIRSGIDPNAPLLDAVEAARGLDTQLAREIVGSLAESPALSRLVEIDELHSSTQDALQRFRAEMADTVFHDVDDVVDRLVSLGASERDRARIASVVKDILLPLTTELEPTRDD